MKKSGIFAAILGGALLSVGCQPADDMAPVSGGSKTSSNSNVTTGPVVETPAPATPAPPAAENSSIQVPPADAPATPPATPAAEAPPADAPATPPADAPATPPAEAPPAETK